MNKIQKFII